MGILGAIAGAAGSEQTTSTTRRVQVGAESDLERQARELQERQLGGVEELVGLGPGAQDVTAGLEAQRGFAEQLQAAAATSGLPTAQDITSAQQFAQTQFAPQQVAFQQALDDQRRFAARQAGARGVTQDDPILQAKLAQIGARGQERIGAAEGAFASQFAQQLPGQRLGLQGQLSQVRSGLASQALRNRQALLSIGQSIQGQGQQFRLGTATTVSSTRQQQGGGLGGAITGAIGGAGAAASIFGSFGGFSGGGGTQALGGGAIGGGFGGSNLTGGTANFAAGAASPSGGFFGAPTAGPRTQTFGQFIP